MEHVVGQLLDNYLNTPGKMIRPRLVQLMGKNWGLSDEEIILIAKAADKIHNASLIHDDVIDEATLRRGQKTLNQIVSNAQAVLAGDYLLASVIAEITNSGHTNILKTLAETLQDIVEGEYLQDSLKESGASTFSNLTMVAEKKTGALLAWCCTSTAKLSGLNEEQINKSELIGKKLGVAFQLIDDNLDYSPKSEKDFAKDLKSGLINFTTLELITLFPERLYPVHQLRKKDFSHTPWSEEEMNIAKQQVKIKADLLVEETKRLILELGGKNTSSIINFIDELKGRIK